MKTATEDDEGDVDEAWRAWSAEFDRVAATVENAVAIGFGRLMNGSKPRRGCAWYQKNSLMSS